MNSTLNVRLIDDDFSINDFSETNWEIADKAVLSKYWSGDAAPPERQATARLLWTRAALCVRFDCAQGEPFVVNKNPRLDVEAVELWERDVCEVFVATDKNAPENYFEFEVAPTGEWLDYAIRQLPGKRETDTSFDSGIKTAARIGANEFSIIFKIAWRAFGKTPESNAEWRGNLLRCVGAGATRGYLTWQPTFTAKPNFHVPAAFGTFKFVG